jgi:hypothetical protein
MSNILARVFFAFTQLILFGGLWLWWEPAKQRPVLTLLFSILYELLTFGLTFGKKVWAKLEEKAVQGVADWAQMAWTGYAPRFRRLYKRQMINEHGTFNVRGLGLINTFTIELENVFVELRIIPSINPQKPNIDMVGAKELKGNHPIWHFLRTIRNATAIAVIGAPGSGKTTLLQHVALTLASNKHKAHRHRSYLPVMLFLRDHIATVTQNPLLPLARLTEEFFNAKHPNLAAPKGWFELQLRRGRCMVLLDGLDEVAEPRHRRIVSTWVDEQILTYPSSRFILSARPQGYRDAPLQRANVLEVQPFNNDQVRRFIENWYVANEIKSAGDKDNERVRYRATEGATDLIKRLRVTPALRELTVNPLLLTMIAMVHRYHGALPGSRVELYSEICEVLLGRWRQAKGVKDLVSAAQKRVVLQPLAAHMMGLKLRDITQKEAMKVIAPFLRRIGVYDEAASAFLPELEASSGLFLEREPGHWSFAHLTFQEYLTAAYWLSQSDFNRSWAGLVSDSWWHETLRLYAAQGDATQVVKACLDADNLASLALAADCLEEARELDPEMRSAVVERVTAGLESPDEARRSLAVRVQLARRLKSLQRIDDECEIDPDFITNAEYQYFLNDLRGVGEYHQPDHWANFNYRRGEAYRPISGIRAEDAEAFCRWLTEIRPADETYRLPHQAEARSHPAKHPTLATLCKDADHFSLFGLPETTKQTISAQLSTLVRSTMEVPHVPFDTPLPAPTPKTVLTLLAVGLTLNLDLARAIALNHKSASLRDDELVLAVEIALTRDLTSESEFEERQRLMLANARYKALVLARKLTRELMLARGRALASEHAKTGPGDLALAETIARQRDSDKDRDREIDLDSVETLLNSTLRSRDPKPEEIGAAAEQLVVAKMEETDSPGLRVRLAMLGDLLAAANAKELVIARAVYRKFLAHALESAHMNLNRIEAEHLGAAWNRRERDLLLAQRRTVLEIYSWLEIVMGRETGVLTGWEGMRIARQ